MEKSIYQYERPEISYKSREKIMLMKIINHSLVKHHNDEPIGSFST